MDKLYILCFLLIQLNVQLTSSHSEDDHMTQQDIDKIINESVITYGSALRIENALTRYSLYSTAMTWGTGSHLQIITAIKNKDDPNGIWVIKEKNNAEMKDTGEPVKCNDIIRLEHSGTGKNLHSHAYPSWIT